MFETFCPERILLRAPNWLGDCIMAIPAMRAFKEIYPESRITAAVEEPFRELYSSEPWCDDTVVIGTGRGITGALKRYRWSRSLSAESFDMAVLFPNSFASALEPFLARIPVRLGYARDCRSVLLTHKVRADRGIRDIHQIFYYMRIPESVRTHDPAPPVGGKGDLPVPRLSVPDEMIERAGDMLKSRLNTDPEEKKPVVWAPGASYGPAKMWPSEYVITVIQTIYAQHGIETVLVGAEGEKDICEKIQESVSGAAVSLCGETGIDELAGILSWGCQYIGNDSGASHMAAAVGIPVLVLFGSTSYAHTVPSGPNTDIISLDLDCSPCMKRTCPLNHRQCMYDITPNMVMEKFSL